MKALLSVALISVCIAALAVAYYFAYSLPKSHTVEEAEKQKQAISIQLFDLGRRCKEDGDKFFQQFRQENYNKNDDWDNPEYHYSRKLNTCIVHTRHVLPLSSGGSYQYNEVYDIYGNHAIIYGWCHRDATSKETLADTLDDKPNYLTAEYFKQMYKLFSE